VIELKRIPRLTRRMLTISIFLMLFWYVPAVASTLDVRMNGARLSLEAQDADMTDVLQAVAKKTGIQINVAPGVSGRVTVKLSDVSLEELLKLLFTSRTIVYRYIPETNTYEILQAGAYASTAGDKAGYTAGEQTGGSAQMQSPPAVGKDGRQKGGIGGCTDENPTDSRGVPYLIHVDLTSTTTIEGVEDLTVGGSVLTNCIKVTNQINQYVRETGKTLTGAVNHYWFAKDVGCVKTDKETVVTAKINGVLKIF
jgi:hypothetical protein